ncbi:transporter substrate-binding domain-containing protein [Aliiglaciecola sp. CAU 1673]|uniref:transporter substrate-binding domain-containing protein n=1 Tax=Aliiglaciecola sp. CAU 1673 TaxID=3032595 RepID=UPI0023DBB56B|nr:transporter substrate-binding domain-containing protein [Aliiglaciecola sp. CAU 1673]MDF2177031.1 transporter substrate-binding domain-containing protein [Aliiglaciecola sp. CAU 1673]
MLRAFRVAVWLVLWMPFFVFAGETWKITSLDWEPYSGATLSNQGNAITKLRELLRRQDIQLVVEFYPWGRAKRIAAEPEYVGYFPAWPEEVEQGFVGSLPVDWSEIAVLGNELAPKSHISLEQLFMDYQVGLVRSYVYPDYIQRLASDYQVNVDLANDEMSLLKKLSLGRHALAITDPTVMLYLAGREGIDNVHVIDVLTKKELVMAFRDDPENRRRLQLLNTALKALKNQ